MKNQKGITMIALAITIVVLLILTFTVTINLEGYKTQSQKSKFKSDLAKLTEEVSQYYAREKKLPYLEIEEGKPIKFDKTVLTEKLGDAINVNDNDVYYVLDASKLKIDLNYGLYVKELAKDGTIENDTISDATLDIYIVNEQSHAIYYPKGVKFDETINYTSKSSYTKIENRSIEF